MDSSTFSIDEVSSINSDSALTNNNDEYYHQSDKRSELSDDNELSTESSEEFEVIREKTKLVEEDRSKRCSIEDMQSIFLTSKLEQSCTSTDNASDNIIRKRSIKNEKCILHKDSIRDKQTEQSSRIGDGAHKENCNKQLTVKNYSALIIISIVSIIVSAVIIPIYRSRFNQDDEKAISAIKLRDAIITEQKRIIEGFRTEAKNAKDETETAGIRLRDGIIAEQKQIIEELRDELKNLRTITSDSLKVTIGEERRRAFERKSGYDYRMVIMDWKKEGNDEGHLSRQHLRLSLKQCNRSSIFVYDHGPVSGRLFSVGDRFIDVDGKHFTAVTELRDYILWSFNKRDVFTAIIERPVSEQALLDVKECLKPNSSSFSTIVSTRI